MTWLNLPALFGLVAVGVPIVIHLLGRRRARRQKFPTLRFLDASRLLPTRRTRLTDLPLLLVRAAIVAAAALALAQPLLLTAHRAASLQTTVARAIVVDTSASMFRPTAPGTAGPRRVDVARTAARRLASEANASLIIESATVRRAIPGAVEWLGSQSGNATVTIISDFQSGTIDAADLAVVPTDVGMALVPVTAAVDTAPPVVIVHGGNAITTARIALAPTRTAVEWKSVPITGDTVARSPALLTGSGERTAAAAAEHAALVSGGSWTLVKDQPIAILYPGFARRPELLRDAKPLTLPWMADVVARLRGDSALIAAAYGATPTALDLPSTPTNPASLASPFVVAAHDAARRPIAIATVGVVAGRPTLLLVAAVEAGSLASAALIGAVAHAAIAPVPVTELEPSAIPADQLRRWERPATPVSRLGADAGSGDSDGRWLWMIALALLALETWMRRSRPESVDQQQRNERAHDRAA